MSQKDDVTRPTDLPDVNILLVTKVDLAKVVATRWQESNSRLRRVSKTLPTSIDRFLVVPAMLFSSLPAKGNVLSGIQDRSVLSDVLHY